MKNDLDKPEGEGRKVDQEVEAEELRKSKYWKLTKRD